MIFNQKQWSLLETLRKRILMLNAGGHMEWLGHVFHGKCPTECTKWMNASLNSLPIKTTLEIEFH